MSYLLLCYDIKEDKTRNRLYKYLLGIDSIPLQKSVHLVPHNYKNKGQKLRWIEDEIVPKLKVNDQIHVFPFTDDCIKGLISLKTNINLSFLLKTEEIAII